MNKKPLGLYKLGSVLKPLIMAIGRTISMTDMYDVTSLKLGTHQIHDYVNYEGIYSTVHILSKASNKGIAKVGLSIGNFTIIQYFSDLNLVSELQDLELPEKSGSKFVKFDKWNNLATAAVFYGCGISNTPLYHV